MKILVTSSGSNETSTLDSRFGRCSYFCIYDTKTGEKTFLANPHKDDAGGAGPAAAQYVASKGVQHVYSGDFGPKAKQVFDRLHIECHIFDSSEQTVEAFLLTLSSI